MTLVLPLKVMAGPQLGPLVVALNRADYEPLEETAPAWAPEPEREEDLSPPMKALDTLASRQWWESWSELPSKERAPDSTKKQEKVNRQG